MAKWQFTRPGTWSYPTLGFTATTGDVLDASNAPDAWWDSVDAGTPATIGVSPVVDYVEPIDGTVLSYNANTNRYDERNLDEMLEERIADTGSATRASLNATYVSVGDAFVDLRKFLPPTYEAGDDVTTYLQAAADYAGTGDAFHEPCGKVLIVGDYYVAGTVNLWFANLPVEFIGGTPGSHAGNWATSRLYTDGTNTMFHVQRAGCGFRDLLLKYTGVARATAGVAIKGTTADALRLENVHIDSFYDGIEILSGGDWKLTHCMIRSWVNNGLRFANSVNTDHSDAGIADCWFVNLDYGYTAGTAIKMLNAGGLRMTSVKINGSMTNGIEMSLNANTMDLHIVNCSIENMKQHGIWLHQDGASTATFSQIKIIGGNIMRQGESSSYNDIRIDPANGSQPFTGISIVGVGFRTFNSYDTAIHVSNVRDFRQSGNTFDGAYVETSVVSNSVEALRDQPGDSVWIPAQQFISVAGATFSSIERWPVWLMGATTFDVISASISTVPWRYAFAEVWFVNPNASTGTARMLITIDAKAPGSVVAVGGTTGSQTIDATTDGVANKLYRVFPWQSALSPGTRAANLATVGAAITVQVKRDGAAAGDTLANAIGVVGVLLRRANAT